MTDYKVGNLQIVFDTLNQTDEGFKKLASNLRAVQKAIAKIGDTDLKPFVANIKQITKSFTPLLTNISGASEGIIALNQSIQKIGLRNLSKAAQEYGKIQSTIEDTTKENNELNSSITETENELGNVEKTTPISKYKISLTQKFTQAMRELWGELNKTNTATKKGTNSFSKFFSSIKRIALYRLIRTVLKQITQSFTETVKAFSEVDDSVNDTMSNITSSLNVIKLSFGSVILPLLQIVEPIIRQISIAFANLANIILQAMSDGETFTAVNANYWEDYRKQLEKTKGSLLDFDKIRALNTNKAGSLSDALIPNQTVDKSDERVTKLRETFEKLRIVFSKVFDILKRVGEPVFNVFITLLDTAITVLTPVINAIADFVRELDGMGLLEPIIWGITAALLAMGAVKVINGISNVVSVISNLQLTSLSLYATIGILAGAIAYFVSSLDEIGGAAKVLIPVISALIAVFAGLAVAKAAAAAGIAAPIQAGITAAALVAAIGLVAGTAIAKSVSSNISSNSKGGGFRPKGYANGGIPSRGTLFYAGEAGAETVSVGSSGRTEVTNVQQMEQALYNALVRYGKQARGNEGGNININIDGQQIFTATRRVANKKGLDFSRI